MDARNVLDLVGCLASRYGRILDLQDDLIQLHCHWVEELTRAIGSVFGVSFNSFGPFSLFVLVEAPVFSLMVRRRLLELASSILDELGVVWVEHMAVLRLADAMSSSSFLPLVLAPALAFTLSSTVFGSMKLLHAV